MFAGIDSKEGYSPEIILLLSLVTAIILYACYLYTKRSKETEKNNLIYLIYGSIIVVLSNLVYFSYEFSGHFLIITGFFFIYLALYKSSVILPYEKLAIAEEKLRKGVENKYRNLFDNANDAIITTDLKDCVTSWNHSAETLFGWEVEKVMGKKLSELFLLSQLASGIGTVYIHETGIRIFVSLTMSQLLDSNQNLTGLSFIIHDITERKKAEDLLIKSKEFNETVINSMNDAISVIDVNNFRIIDANSVFLENYGMKKDEVIGKTCYEITHKNVKPCSPPDDICPLMDTLNTGKHSTAEHVHYMKDGKKRYVEVLTSPIMDENGKVVSVIHVSRDITERKQAEKTIEVSWVFLLNAPER
jgi:PAS domain S-box-containing protein